MAIGKPLIIGIIVTAVALVASSASAATTSGATTKLDPKPDDNKGEDKPDDNKGEDKPDDPDLEGVDTLPDLYPEGDPRTNPNLLRDRERDLAVIWKGKWRTTLASRSYPTAPDADPDAPWNDGLGVDFFRLRGNRRLANWGANVLFWFLYCDPMSDWVRMGNEPAPWKILDPKSTWVPVWNRLLKFLKDNGVAQSLPSQEPAPLIIEDQAPLALFELPPYAADKVGWSNTQEAFNVLRGFVVEYRNGNLTPSGDTARRGIAALAYSKLQAQGWPSFADACSTNAPAACKFAVDAAKYLAAREAH